MIKFEPLDDAITYAAEHPAEFYMQAWFKQTECGTTACLAGTIALQAGWAPTGWTTTRANGEPPKAGESRASRVLKDSRIDTVSSVAAEVLGLNEVFDSRLLDELFHAENLARVIRIRNRLAADAGVPERTWTVAR